LGAKNHELTSVDKETGKYDVFRLENCDFMMVLLRFEMENLEILGPHHSKLVRGLMQKWLSVR
jgi:hypothetical protein